MRYKHAIFTTESCDETKAHQMGGEGGREVGGFPWEVESPLSGPRQEAHVLKESHAAVRCIARDAASDTVAIFLFPKRTGVK